ncbi:MAG: hypothetical protein ACT4QC_04500 [Planctomycetaceae bacterium]
MTKFECRIRGEARLTNCRWTGGVVGRSSFVIRHSSFSARRDSSSGIRHFHSRRGLAPLELVLSLPLLLVIMCLIINIGTAGKWKVMALAVSRQAAWRDRDDRKGASDPRPAGWPAKATLAVTPADPPPLFPQDPFASHTVVRGPVLGNLQGLSPGSQLIVDTKMLDSTLGFQQGVSQIDRAFPVFPKIGGVHLLTKHPLLESQWRFQQMGYGSNISRRILRLYRFVPSGDIQALANEYQQAALAILNAQLREDLYPLYRDDEFLAWYGSAPDFRPEFPWRTVCELDRGAVRAGPVERLIWQIQGNRNRKPPVASVPRKMAEAFIRMYRQQYEQTQDAGLKLLIDQLSKFLQTLD